jgi:hypothetical protein
MRTASGLDRIRSVLVSRIRSVLVSRRRISSIGHSFRTQNSPPSAGRQHLYQPLNPHMNNSNPGDALNVEAAAAALEEAGAPHLPWYELRSAESAEHACICA